MRIDIPTVTLMIIIGAALMSGGLFAFARGPAPCARASA